MKALILDGTPEEIVRAYQGLGINQPAAPISTEPPIAGPVINDGERHYISLQSAKLFLTRRKLSPEQLALFKHLYSHHPDLVPAADLQKVTKYTPAQFSGLMGALGRRMWHTPGVEEGVVTDLFKWDGQSGQYRYGLPDSLYQALRDAKLF